MLVISKCFILFNVLALVNALALFSPPVVANEMAQQVQTWLEKADHFRQPFKSGQLVTSLTLFKQGKAQQSSEFLIQLNDQGDSRVTMLNQRSKGQKVLLTQSAMWLYVPRTHKAIRITPMQRLMGQASYGDVSSLSWQHEYQWDKKNPLINNDNVCLGLSAKRKSATYRAINVCLDKHSSRPLSADFYLASGKLMKTAHYLIDQDNPQLISTTRFTVPTKNSQYTLMENTNYVAKKHKKHIFTRQGFIKR